MVVWCDEAQRGHACSFPERRCIQVSRGLFLDVLRRVKRWQLVFRGGRGTQEVRNRSRKDENRRSNVPHFHKDSTQDVKKRFFLLRKDNSSKVSLFALTGNPLWLNILAPETYSQTLGVGKAPADAKIYFHSFIRFRQAVSHFDRKMTLVFSEEA